MTLNHLPAELPVLNTNTIVITGLVVAGLYGLMAGKQRLRILILSVYVGIVIAEQFTGMIAPSVKFMGHDQVSWALLGIPILIFGFLGVVHGKGHAKGWVIGNIIVGLLTGALIISSGLRLLPTSELTAVDSDSFLAMNLQQFHPYILGLLPVVALVLGFMKSEKKH